MCRTANYRYRTSFVCVPCRHVAQYLPGTPARCPRCQNAMTEAGRDFHAPRKDNTSGWAAVGFILNSGARYDSCGCTGPGYRPGTGAAVRQDGTERPFPEPNRKPPSLLDGAASST